MAQAQTAALSDSKYNIRGILASFVNCDEACFENARPLTLRDYVDEEQDEQVKPMRVESLRFHIKHDDYFATLATVIDLLIHEKEGIANEQQNKILRGIMNDLIYLQKHYKIEKRKGLY